MQGRFKDSRQLICQTAKIDVSDPMKISSQSIRSRTSDSLIHRMLDVEQAFVAIRQTFSKDEPTEAMAMETAGDLKNILPLMTNNKEKLTIRYWIDNCNAYIPDIIPEKRAENIKEIITLLPKGTNDSALYSYSLIIKDLNIPAADKYLIIKKAYHKTNKNTHYPPRYKELLNKTGQTYYQVLHNTFNRDDTPYVQRCAAAYEAVNVINDLNGSISNKCRMKIELLDKVERLQQQHGDAQGIQKTSLLRRKYINHLNNIGHFFLSPKNDHYYR